MVVAVIACDLAGLWMEVVACDWADRLTAKVAVGFSRQVVMRHLG